MAILQTKPAFVGLRPSLSLRMNRGEISAAGSPKNYHTNGISADGDFIVADIDRDIEGAVHGARKGFGLICAKPADQSGIA